jgi:hypothetical protein
MEKKAAAAEIRAYAVQLQEVLYNMRKEYLLSDRVLNLIEEDMKNVNSKSAKEKRIVYDRISNTIKDMFNE